MGIVEIAAQHIEVASDEWSQPLNKRECRQLAEHLHRAGLLNTGNQVVGDVHGTVTQISGDLHRPVQF
jgi:hypothetical protein